MAAKLAAIHEAERAAQLAAGAERIAFRREAAAERAAARAQLEATAAALEAARGEALAKLAACVPYYADVMRIASTSDAARTTGHTASTAHSAALSGAYAQFLQAMRSGEAGTKSTSHGAVDLSGAAREAAGTVRLDATRAGHADALAELAAQRTAEQGIFRRAGYADTTITRDPRWRFAAALQQDASGKGLSAAATRQAFNTLLAPTGRGAEAARRGASTFSLADAASS